MKDPFLADTIGGNIAIAIVNDGALGSPLALHRLSRAIGRLSGDSAGFDFVKGAAFLMDVGRTLFVTRNPRVDYRTLRKKDPALTRPHPDVFTLCGRAVAKAVFFRDWDASAALFNLALVHPAAVSSMYVRRAVIGLKERFLLLPCTGSGVRHRSADTDLLWRLNHAEEQFCRGNIAAAHAMAESIAQVNPAFGWARSLLIRILFCRSDFNGARAVLSNSGVGALGAAEELAWNAILPGAEDLASPDRPSPLAPARFRLPLYFQALSHLLRGDSGTASALLKSAYRSGEPTSLMVDHDPVILRALRVEAKEDITAPGRSGEDLRENQI